MLADGRLPSLAKVARAAGLSKAGVLHHYPSMSALVHAYVARELDRADDVFARARAEGRLARVWLEQSTPDAGERDTFLTLGGAFRSAESGSGATTALVRTHIQRWQEWLADELGDPDQALLVRLLCDGLLLNAISGTPVSAADVSRISRLVRGS